MTDRELLELAAKAAKLSVFWGHPSSDCYDHNKLYLEQDKVVYTAREWNPLEDDGDALRLAVKFLFEIDMGRGCIAIRHSTGFKILEDFNHDPYAATRRAIVRFAAEIGRNMK